MKTKMIKKILPYLIPIIILMILSLLNLYYAPNISNLYNNFFQRQIVWYSLSIILFISLLILKPKFILKYSFYIYVFNIILLFLVLFLGKAINGSKAWFKFD